jgi:hypothetical protein
MRPEIKTKMTQVLEKINGRERHSLIWWKRSLENNRSRGPLNNDWQGVEDIYILLHTLLKRKNRG